jgi:RNA methyltransferase, TrmH family
LIGRRADRLEEQLFVVEGQQLLDEAVRAGWNVHSVYLSSEAKELDAFPNAFRLDAQVMERVVSTDSAQPVLAVVGRRTEVLRRAEGWIVVADRVADPGNLGTIMRSAEAAGASCVVLTPGTVDAFNPKVVRASAGSLFHVGVVEGVELDEVKHGGYRLIGTTSRSEMGAVDYRRADLSGHVAVLLGNEAHGVDADAPVDDWVTITHQGRSESLNVAMAGTLLCFEVSARHQSVNPAD